MKEKKASGRFTLQFNLEDPQQKMVSDLLEQHGRHKAQFLTSAVLYYTQHAGAQENSGSPAKIDEALLARVLLMIMGKYPQISPAVSDGPPRQEEPPAQVPSVNTPAASIDADAMAAIAETLDAFNKM